MRPAKSYDEMHPGRFLKAALFGGKPRTLTIKEMCVDDLDRAGVKETEGVVTFIETDRQLILNATNRQCWIALFGSNPKDAEGHKVTLYPTRTKLGPDDVDAIRVWGSPELKSDKVIQIKLPQRNPLKMTLRAVKPTPGAEPDTAPTTREPGSDDE